MKKLLIIGILFLNSALLYSQQSDIDLVKQNEKQLAAQIELLLIEKEKYLQQSDSLAALIQQLKSKQDLNIFQRRRLEQLLKASQELDQNILAVDQKIEKADREHQTALRKLVAWYDSQIAQWIDSGKGKKISQEQLERLATWQRERQEYASKIKQDQLQRQISRPIQIEESDSYHTIKQKADLVKDQEDKARRQMALVEQRVRALQKELKLRSRMNELIADTYLLDQPTEKLLPQSQVRGANENAVFSDGEKSRAQSSATFDVVDNLLLKADVSGISTMDLESQLRNLLQMKARLAQTADSLGAVAEQFYQAAEQKRRDEQTN